MYQRIKAALKRYEKWLIPGALIVGFVVDFVTFRSLQPRTTFALLGLHVLVAGALQLYIRWFDQGKKSHRALNLLRLGAPFVLQLSFGALLSAALIFYWFSGALSISWPFFLLVTILMVTNETMRSYYERPLVQTGVYFFAVFSFSTLLLPFLLNSIEAWVFLVGGVASLLCIFLYLSLAFYLIPDFSHRQSSFVLVVGVIWVAMNGLYAANLIPPIPLSLREAGVYYSVQRQGGVYTLVGESESFAERLWPGNTLYVQPGDPVYVFTSVYSPTDFRARIVHDWEFFDPETKRWIERDDLSFAVIGGREGGYRGFSWKGSVEAGRWRVTVRTERGQALGRIPFRILPASTEVNRVITTR